MDDGWGVPESASAPMTPHGESAPLHANVSFRKCDDEQQLVFGEVFAPGFPDSQNDFMTKETIQNMAYEFMRKGLLKKIDVAHSREESGCYVVESFIARDDDPTFIPGSWVLGVHIPDVHTWGLVKSGELNGFSLDGMGVRVDTQLTIEMPETITGETDDVQDHRHEFFVKYDDAGRFMGGLTSPGPDGHVHGILRGTITEVSESHAHRFSYVEGVLSAQAAA